MDFIPLLIPLAKARLKTMDRQEKENVLQLVKNVADILLTGDHDLIDLLLDQLGVDQKVREFILSEFAYVNAVK
jgi:hypothetical protein